MKDDLRAINVALPKLPDESTPQAALRCGDWIIEIEPLIGDVSGGAARWWTQLMIEVNAVYKVWLSSDALTRLEVDVQVKPNATRLEGRVTSMLLAALPSSIKSDIIANRKLTAASIMLEVMKRFQPGGLGEKSGLLRALTTPDTATSPADGVEKLRLWSRNVARAVELGVTLPDPVLQIGALDSICRQILNKEPQINFRVQSWRHSNNLDTTTQQSVATRFAQLLQAELTTAALAGDRKDTPEVKVKQLQQNSDKPVTKVACRNWCTSTGCARGASCRFVHDWTGVQDKNDRCWNCSSLAHRKHECPAGDKTKSPEKAENKGKDIKEGKDYTNSKGKGKATGKGKPQLNKTTSSAATTASSTTPASDAAGGGSGNSQAVENAETSTMATRSASVASEKPPAVGDGGKAAPSELIGEVTSLLRSLRAPQPAIRAIIAKVTYEGCGVLLDSGATHILRAPVSQEEWQRAGETVVQTATGECILRQTQSGVLLTNDGDVAPVIPLGELVAQGGVIDWRPGQCRLHHPKAGTLTVRVVANCP